MYVDTGAMYRGINLLCNATSIGFRAIFRQGGLTAQLPQIKLQFKFNPALGFAEMYVNEINVEQQIRTIEVSRLVSKIAEISEVRAKLVEQQQQMGKR